MSSDRDPLKRRDRGADGTAGQGEASSPDRAGARLEQLRARMRAIETGTAGRTRAPARQAPADRSSPGGLPGACLTGAPDGGAAGLPSANAVTGPDGTVVGDGFRIAGTGFADRKPVSPAALAACATAGPASGPQADDDRAEQGGGHIRRSPAAAAADGASEVSARLRLPAEPGETGGSHPAAGSAPGPHEPPARRQALRKPHFAEPALFGSDLAGPESAEPSLAGPDFAEPRLAGPARAGSASPAAPPDPARTPADPAAGPLGDPAADPFGDSAYRPLFDESSSGRRERRRPREQTPTQRALGLLTRREHSRKELTRKLTSRGLDREEVEAAVDRLTDAGWQDDARFAESLVRSRAGNGYGPVHIRAELGMHGLDGEAIARALAGYEGDWLQNARDLLLRRLGEGFADDPALRRKAADLLLRRGFDGETARNANRSWAED